MKSLDKLSVVVWAGLFLGSAAPAMANVIFTTAGSFSGPNASGSDLIFTGDSGSSSVTFSGAQSTSLSIPGTYINQDFGSFDFSVPQDLVDTGYLLPGNKFELVVTQSAPTAHSGFVQSTLLDGIVESSGHALFIEFPSAGAAISFDGGAEQYIVNPVRIKSIGGPASVELTGTVITTPSPSSAVGGVIFCGLLFLVRPRRTPIA